MRSIGDIERDLLEPQGEDFFHEDGWEDYLSWFQPDNAIFEKINPLICSCRFRILAVIDDFSCKNLVLVADTSLSGGRVARELMVLVERYGKPLMIVSDNGTEFTSLSHARQVLDDWREDYNTVRPHSQLGGRTLVRRSTQSHKKQELSF